MLLSKPWDCTHNCPPVVGCCVFNPTRPALRFATGLVLVRASPDTPRYPTTMETEATKTSRIDLRVNQLERQQIAQKAEAAGLKLSEYLRRSALGVTAGETPVASPTSAILTKPERAQLASIANNLNQLTRHAHTGQLDVAGINALVSHLKHLLA